MFVKSGVTTENHMYWRVQPTRTSLNPHVDQGKRHARLILCSVLLIAFATTSGQAAALSQEVPMVNLPSDVAAQSGTTRAAAPTSDAPAHGATSANVDLGAGASNAVGPSSGGTKASTAPAGPAAAADTDVAQAPLRVPMIQQSVGTSAAGATAAAAMSASTAAPGKAGADVDGPAK